MSFGSPSHGEFINSTDCVPCPEGSACMNIGIYNVTDEATLASAGYFIALQGKNNLLTKIGFTSI